MQGAIAAVQIKTIAMNETHSLPEIPQIKFTNAKFTKYLLFVYKLKIA